MTQHAAPGYTQVMHAASYFVGHDLGKLCTDIPLSLAMSRNLNNKVLNVGLHVGVFVMTLRTC